MKFTNGTLQEVKAVIGGLFSKRIFGEEKIYLTSAECKAIHLLVIYRSQEKDKIEINGGVFQPNILDMILANISHFERQLETKNRQELIFHCGAYLMKEIIEKHPFLDGNKRTGFVIATTFIQVNIFDFEKFPDDELIEFTKQIAQGNKTEEDIYSWLIKHIKTK